MLLNRKTGFAVGPTINPCTKGLWIWGQAIPGTTVDGEPCSILVVDSEGIGALDEDSNHDCKIFSLAILLSSCFIYNSVGSIDEAALQNLSLVVNLTEHIHVKTQQEEIDCEDYAAVFPSFLWVVRDFVLQLVSPEGEPMTSKEYFEKALQPQKGYSDAAEEKNRIRRLLKNFFKDRDCQTLVRPITEEDELQTLAEKELEELRPEFVDQMMELRGKALGRVKAKKLNGKSIDGGMLAHLAAVYVESINSGTVPNIESAWQYICKNESAKALADAMTLYERKVGAVVSAKFPLDENELKDVHKDAKTDAVEYFVSKAMGVDREDGLTSLKEAIARKNDTLRLENEEEGLKVARDFLAENYAGIDRRVKDGEIKSFLEFEKIIRNFEEFVMEHGPPCPNRQQIALGFLQAKTLEASDTFIKSLSNEVEMSSSLNQEHLTRIETELRLVKEEGMKEKDQLQSRITASESEKAEIRAKEQSLQMQLDSIREDKGYSEKRLQSELSDLKAEYKALLADEGSKAGQYETTAKEAERKVFELQAEFEQEKALLTQQVEFLKVTIEELSKRENDYSTELSEGAKKHTGLLKDIHERYEGQISTLRNNLEAAQELLLVHEKATEDTSGLLEHERALWETERADLDQKFETMQSEMQILKTAIQSKEGQTKAKMAELSTGHEQSTVKLRARLEEMEKKLRQTEDTLTADRNSWEKDNAIMIQKVEFLETQLSETTEAYEDSKRHQEKMVKAMQDVNSDETMRQELDVQLTHIKETHFTELRKIESQHEVEKKTLKSDLEQAQEAFNELELKVKMDTSDLAYLNTVLSEKNAAVETELTSLKQVMAQYELDNEKIKEGVEAQYKTRVAEMDAKMQDIEETCQAEINQIHAKSEDSLIQLKEYYEQEKERLESRSVEDKERSDKRYNLMIEEFEARIKEDRENYEDEIAALQDDIREIDSASSNDLVALKNQKSLDSQKIETLDAYLKETKEQLKAVHSSHAGSMESQLENFNKERQSLLEKIEKLANDSACKDRDLTAAMYKKEQLETVIASRDKELEDIKGDVGKDRSLMLERLEDAKLKNQTIADEFIQKKNDYKREIALTTQHIEFQAKKITDLERALEEANKRYNEKLKSLKDETGYEYTDTIEKLTNEKSNLERRLDTKRNEYKELEISKTRQVNNLEKEKAVLLEKFNTLHSKMEELQGRYNSDMKDLGRQLNETKESENTDRMSLHLENERLKTLTQELEKEVNERNSAYERDRTLWENKFNFLAQQRDQSRHELADAQRKFEQTLDQLQKRGSFEKDKLESTTSSLISSVETRYTNQIKELQEQHASSISEIVERNKHLETEARLLKEELQLERRSRSSDSGTLEVRLSTLHENEANLKIQIASMKEDRDKKIQELGRCHEDERDNLRTKISELEKRTKDAENYRGQLFLEHEKERAKWALERDHLISQKNDAQDMIERLEKRKEALLRENEKYRSERGPRQRVVSMLRKENGPPRPLTSVLGSSISFEEFNRDKCRDVPVDTANTTPRSIEVRSDKSPPPRSRTFNGMMAYSPGIRELGERNVSNRYSDSK